MEVTAREAKAKTVMTPALTEPRYHFKRIVIEKLNIGNNVDPANEQDT